MDKPRRTTETSGSDCRELGGRLKPVADWAASRQPEARAAKRRPSVSTASTIQRDKFWGAPPVMLWCCDLRFAVNPHGVGKKSSVLMASCNDLIKRNRDFENNSQDDSRFQTRRASLIGCPIGNTRIATLVSSANLSPAPTHFGS